MSFSVFKTALIPSFIYFLKIFFFKNNPNPFLPLRRGFNPPPAPSLSREGSNRDYSSLLH